MAEKTQPKQPQIILTYNNDHDGTGWHIAQLKVNISSVIALNLVCDVIEGSYQINLDQSNQAQSIHSFFICVNSSTKISNY